LNGLSTNGNSKGGRGSNGPDGLIIPLKTRKKKCAELNIEKNPTSRKTE